MEAVLADALRVLEEIGVECVHEGAVKRILRWPGASYVDGRLRFASSRVGEYLDAIRANLAADSADDEEFSLGGCWTCLNYCDPLTQDVRPATSEEAAEMTRLWDARGDTGTIPLMPGDVPPELATLASERIALTNSRRLGGSLTVMDPEEVRFLIDMYQAAGRRYVLLEQVGVSPLRLNPVAMETVLCFIDHPDVDVRMGGAIPMAGATCPLDPRSAMVQSLAEEISLHIVRSAILGADGNSVDPRLEPFDFQYSTIVFGSAEWCLYRSLIAQISQHISGRPMRGGSFRSVAKRPDAQAACERTASALWQAMLGSRRFWAVGQLSVDEVFSPQQAVLDGEILGYVERVIKGIDTKPVQADVLEMIRQGIRDGSFLGLDDTVNRFRDFCYFPEIFRHWNLNRWRHEGEPSVLAEAWSRAHEQIAACTFRLDEDREKQVDAIYKKACRYVRERT